MGDRKRRERGNDPKFSNAPVPRGMRRLDVFGRTWLWRYGGHRVEIRSPDGGTESVPLTELLGMSHQDIEEAEYDRRIEVKPSTILDRIRRTTLGYTDAAGYPADSVGHGHQIDVRPGWTAFTGPRGTWQARVGVWIVDILTPEGVEHQARTYDVLGMPVDAWMTVKTDHLASIGSSIDQAWREHKQSRGPWQDDRLRFWMEYDVPTMPQVTPAMLTDHVVRCIVGPAVRLAA